MKNAVCLSFFGGGGGSETVDGQSHYQLRQMLQGDSNN